MAFAAGMSDNVSAANNVPVTSTFVIGTIIAVLVAASHWLPPPS
jgi:K+ transporter